MKININKNITQKIMIGAIWIAAIMSTIYILMIGWYNVPSLDDYGYIAAVEKDGVWNLVRSAYMGWQCRFSTFFVNGLFMLLFGRAQNLIGMSVIMLCLGWLSIERLFFGISDKYQWKLPSYVRWAAAILITNVGVITFLAPSTFYWFCALNYTIAIWATIFLVYFVFYSSAASWIRWGGSSVCSVYISGSAENYAPLVILILGIVWLIVLCKHKTWRWWTIETTKYLFVSLLLLSAGFLFMLLGPGNKARLEMDGTSSFLQGGISFWAFLKGTIKNVVLYILLFFSRGLYYVALFPVFMWIGRQVENRDFTEISAKRILHILLIWILIVIIEVSACIFAAGYCEPRAFCFMTFVLLALIGYVGVRVGMALRQKSPINSAVIVSTVLFIVFMIFIFFVDRPLVKEYNQYVSTRNKQIAERVQFYTQNAIPKEEQETYICAPFEPHWRPSAYSIMYYFVLKTYGKNDITHQPQELLMISEITDNPSDWRNVGLKSYYHADFDIICRSN